MSELVIGCLQAEKGQFLAAFWCRRRQCIKMTGTSRRPNVVTSQRRDVESTYKEVNKRQRRDAPTSRRQRELFLSIIKRQMGTELEGDRRSKIIRTRARKSEQQ